MTDQWAARLPHSSLHTALPLRLRPGVRAHEDGDHLWLAGDGPVEEIDRILRCIPDIVRYTVEAENAITRVGRRIPDGALPVGPWAPLSSLFQFRPQPGAMPARLELPATIRLIRTAAEQEPAAIIVTIREWANYANGAPQVRLNSLRFAVRADGETLILGRPLPPLPGASYVDRGGLLLPCGYGWEPRIEPEILRRAMNLASNDRALFDSDGHYELVPAETFAEASRAAARRSLANFPETAGTP